MTSLDPGKAAEFLGRANRRSAPSGWSDLAGGARTHWKAPPCHGAHVKRPFDGQQQLPAPKEERPPRSGVSNIVRRTTIRRRSRLNPGRVHCGQEVVTM